MSSSSQNVLVLRLSAFGDVLHTLPAVAALRASMEPDARLGWLVEEQYADLVRLVAPVDEVFATRTRAWRRRPLARATFSEIAKLRRALRQFAGGGTTVDFQGLVKSAAFGRMSGASVRYGFDAASVRERASMLATNRRVAVTPSHVVDMNLQLAGAAGAKWEGAPLDFTRFEADPDGSLARLARQTPVVLNPGAAGVGKTWGADRFAELADALPDDVEVLVVWGPGERPLAERIAGRSRAFMAPPTTLRELAFVLRRARLLVSGDSGPLHLAAVLGTPVIGLYGPTDPMRNGPYGQPGRWVETWATSRKIGDIDVASVVSKVEEVLAEP